MSLPTKHYYNDTQVVLVLARDGEVPPNAVVGGCEEDGTVCYVSQAYRKEGQLAPGKLYPPHGCYYKGCRWIEQASKVYQVLTHPNQNERLKWVPASNGDIPTDALRAGDGPGKSGLYIARVPLAERICCGKYQPAIGCAYLPWNGKEHQLASCEVLCVTTLDC